ncbi:MAG: PAS domain S-box protein [Pyrinomonadaceae bacterium]
MTLHGKPTLIANCIDITERIHAEEALREAEQKYRGIFENAVEGIFQTTPDGHFRAANPALARMLGYDSPEELLASRTDIARQHYVDPEHRLEFKRLLEENGIVHNFEHLAYRKDGGKIWLSENVRSVCDVHGTVLYYEGFTEDITARKEAEREKEQLLARERLARLQAVVMCDANLALTQDLSLERVLETLLEYLRKLVPYDSANVMLMADSSLVVRAIKGYESFTSDVSVLKTNRFDATSNSIIAQICASGRSFLVPDTQQEPRWQLAAGAEHTRNWIGVPLIAYGKIIGLYSVDKAEPDFFTSEHVRLAESIAASAASAIENARLFQRGQEYARELEQRIAERDRVESALRESEAFRRTIIESEPECVTLVGPDFSLLDMNPAGMAMVGADSREQVIGQSILPLIAPEWREAFIAMHERVCQGESVVAEFEIIGRNGVRRLMETHAAPLRDAAVRVIAQLAITRDITGRRQARESLKIFRDLIDRSTDAIQVLDPNTLRFLDCNLAAHQGLGYSREEFLSLSAFDIDPVITPSFAELTLEEMDRSGFAIFESVHRRKDGTTFPVEINVKNIRLEKDYRLAVVRDITERKRSEEALRRAEQRYQDIFENAGEGIFQSTPEGRYITANPALARMHGFDSPEELIRNRTDISREIYAEPERREEFKSLLEQYGMVRGFEHQVIRKDGNRIWITVNARVVRDKQGKVLYYEGTAQDINERKLVEARSAAFATLARNLSGAITQLDAAGIIADTAHELFGWDSCNLDLYDEATDVVDPLLNMDTIDGERVDVTASVAVRKPTPRSRRIIDDGPELTLRKVPVKFEEDSIPFGDNSRPSASLMKVPICHAETVIGLLSIQSYTPNAYDDSDLKDLHALATYCGAALDRVRTEQSLRESEERYRELFENAKDAYYVHDLSGRYISVNRAAEKLCGFPRTEIIGKKFSDFIPSEHLEVVSKNLCHKLIDEGETKYEIEIVAADGRRVPVEVSSHLIYENGVAVRVQGTARDITERKRSEELTFNLRRELELTMNSMEEGVHRVDIQRNIVFENPAAARMLGWEVAELLGKPAHQTMHHARTDGTPYPKEQCPIYATFGDGMSRHVADEVFWRKDGTSFPVEYTTAPVRNDLNEIVAVVVTFRDITARKRVEEALRQSEERFSKAFHSSPAALSIALLEDGRLLEVNAAFLRMTGFSRDEVIGRSTLELGLWDSQHRLMMAKALREHGAVADFEIKFRKKSGEIRDALLSVELIQLGMGKPSVLGIAQDVTERNRAEEAMQRYPRQLIEAQEAERQSIARELHDQIGQVLTAIHLNLQAVRATSDSGNAKALIDEGIAIVDGALGQVRNLSFELRPSLLDDLGLATALRWYTDRFTQRTGIKATTAINLPDPPVRLTRDLETACFRIVQEALTNVVRHARARNVAIRLQGRNGEIRLSVRDNGTGFDAHSQNLAPFTTHVGLRGMRERALALGGRLDVRSSSRGTRISASFPNERQKEDLSAGDNGVATEQS